MNGMMSSSLNLGHGRIWESQLDILSTHTGHAKCSLHPVLLDSSDWILVLGNRLRYVLRFDQISKSELEVLEQGAIEPCGRKFMIPWGPG